MTPQPSITDQDSLSASLESNLESLQLAFKDCLDVTFRRIRTNINQSALLVYIEGITNRESLEDHVCAPLIEQFLSPQQPGTDGLTVENVLTIEGYKKIQLLSEAISEVLEGNAILLLDGASGALVLRVLDGPKRSIQEPASESVIRGPREGFTERIGMNTAMIRLKIKTNRLKLIGFKIGNLTKTDVILAYIDGIANLEVIEVVKKKLSAIRIDGILETGYIEELIEEKPFSPFPEMQYTERPDTAAAQLLEGKFAILVDGTPLVLTGPITFWHMLKSSEDYYERFYFATFVLWLRYFFLFLSLFLPAIYIAITTFHQDLLPTSLVLSIAAARESIPFPAVIEALIMEISFEALREAGIRLPKTVGQAVSILGALVIGQAAVQAGIVSAPIVIIVSLTGIASFTIPRFNFAITIRLLRFPLMLMASAFGLFGIIIGTLWIFIHLSGLQSFGVPYLSGISPMKRDELKDILIRAPWWRMISRPETTIPSNRKRQPGKGWLSSFKRRR